MVRLNGILGGFVFLAFIACAAPAPEPVTEQTEHVVQVRPSGPLFTNQSLELQVDVTGDSDVVEVLRDGQQVAVLQAPYTYVWDTRSVPEGTYALTVRITRGTQVTNSQPVQVTVDRTSPRVVSHVPGALGHVLNAQPLLVRFDEPVRVATPEDGLRVRQKRNAVPVSGQVAVGGSTLKFVPTALEQGSWHEVRVGPGIRDLAGNAAVAISWDVLAQQWEGRTYTLDAPGLVTKPVLVSGAKGKAVALWLQSGDRAGIWASVYENGAWREKQALFTPTLPESMGIPRAVMDASGRIIVVWEAFDPKASPSWRIESVRYVPGSGWSAPLVLSKADVTVSVASPELAGMPDGQAFVAWNESNGVRDLVKVRHYVPGQGWSAAVNVNTDSAVFNVSEKQLACSPTGGVVIVWKSNGVWANRYVPGAGWGAPQKVPGSEDQYILETRVVSGTAGDVVVWGGGVSTIGHVWASAFVPGLGWGQAVGLDARVLGGGAPNVGLLASGEVLVTWSTTVEGLRQVRSRVRSAAGTWSPEAQVPVGDAQPILPRLAVNANGDAVLVWIDSNISKLVYALEYHAGSGWGRPEALVRPVTSAMDWDVALDATGTAYAAWLETPVGTTTTTFHGVVGSTFVLSR